MMEMLTWEDSPLYTFDCAWCCGVDLLRAKSRQAVGTVALTFRDFLRQLTVDVVATVYAVDETNPFGQRLRGHIAVAGYHGGWLVWLAGDLGYDPLGGEGLR